MKLQLSSEHKAAEHLIAAINVKGGFPDSVVTGEHISRAGYLAPSYKRTLVAWLAEVAAAINPDEPVR